MFLRRLNIIHYITNNLNKKSMKKKEYESPTTQIVELQHRTMLLAGSAKRNQLDDLEDYELDDDPFQF